jgi:hypothetical protein
LKKDDLLDLIGKVDDKYIAELYDDTAQDETAGNAGRGQSSGAWKKWACLAACLAVVIAGGFAVLGRGGAATSPAPAPVATAAPVVTAAPEEASSVIIDVNPSIKMNILSDGTVKSVLSLNADARKLLAGLDLEGLDRSECVSEIVAALEKGEYLTQAKNSVLVSVVGESGSKAEQLKNQVVSDVDSAAKRTSLEVSVISQVVPDAGQYENIADKYNISVGKAALINNIVSGMDSYDYAKLARLSIHSLDQIMEYTGSKAASRTGQVAGAISPKVSGELGIAKMAASDALDFAVSMSDAYDKLCELNPAIDTSTYTGYDFHLERGTAADGSTTWAIVAKNTKDNGLPSVTLNLSGDIIPDVASVGKTVVDTTLQIACNIFGLVANRLIG